MADATILYEARFDPLHHDGIAIRVSSERYEHEPKELDGKNPKCYTIQIRVRIEQHYDFIGIDQIDWLTEQLAIAKDLTINYQDSGAYEIARNLAD